MYFKVLYWLITFLYCIAILKTHGGCHTYRSISLSFCPSIHSSTHAPMYLPTYLPIYLFFGRSRHLVQLLCLLNQFFTLLMADTKKNTSSICWMTTNREIQKNFACAKFWTAIPKPTVMEANSGILFEKPAIVADPPSFFYSDLRWSLLRDRCLLRTRAVN
jgi:hypothetical protein